MSGNRDDIVAGFLMESIQSILLPPISR